MTKGAAEARGKKVLVLALLGVVAISCVVASGAAWLAASVLEGAVASPQWGPTAVLAHDVPALFGVPLPKPRRSYTSRVMGFQDPHFEVLVELAPEDAEAFLSAHQLSATPGASAVVLQAKEPLESQGATFSALTVRTLSGFKETAEDGGTLWLVRSGHLLEGEGRAWLYLVAFGT